MNNVYYDLRGWIKPIINKLDTKFLSLNPNAIDFLEKNPDLICNHFIALNTSPKIIDFFLKNPNLICNDTLSSNTSDIVVDFLIENPHLINWKYLSYNSNLKAIILLKENIHLINWDFLSSNINAISILKDNIDKINWDRLCRNKMAFSILEKNIDKINFDILSRNENPDVKFLLKKNIHTKYHDIFRFEYLTDTDINKISESQIKKEETIRNNKLIEEFHWEKISKSSDPKNIKLLEKNIDKINIRSLCENTHPKAILLLKNFFNNKYKWWGGFVGSANRMIDWEKLCSNTNPDIIDILKKHPNKIRWYNLSKNPSDKIIDFLIENIDNIDWKGISENKNPRVINIIEENMNRVNWNEINWKFLSKNPSIFEYDYQRMSIQRTNIILEELMKKTWHPSKIIELLHSGEDIDNF